MVFASLSAWYIAHNCVTKRKEHAIILKSHLSLDYKQAEIKKKLAIVAQNFYLLIKDILMAAKRKKTKPKTKKRSQNNQKIEKTNKLLAYIVWGLSTVVVFLLGIIATYYFTQHEEKTPQKILHIQKEVPPKQSTTKIREELKNVLDSQQKNNYITPSHEIDEKVAIPPQKRVVKRTVKKPKLAIIIDDVCTKTQIRRIHNLGILVNISFLPPSKTRPNSAKLAKKEPAYMVHLPMEAMHFNKEEPFTFHVHDSQNVIKKRIHELKELFPRVKYINNHTGSKFTSNERAMNKLIYVLNKEHILFIDSRTTSRTKVKKVMQNYGLKYLARDIFLDNKQDKAYIQKQIKKAVRIAKKHGSAIAICHPHKITLQTLKDSKELFKDVELVLVDKLY